MTETKPVRPLVEIDRDYNICAIQLGDLEFKKTLLLERLGVLSKEAADGHPEAIKAAQPAATPQAEVSKETTKVV